MRLAPSFFFVGSVGSQLGNVYGNSAYSGSMILGIFTLGSCFHLMTGLMGGTLACWRVRSLAFISDVVNHP
jgi:hypothetical protein